MQELALFIGLIILFLNTVIAVAVSSKRSAARKEEKLAAMGGDKIKDLELTRLHGHLKPPMVCPHCQTKGTVRTKPIVQKKGVSGGKATGAILTGGISLLATGLSRKEDATQAYCDNCHSTWIF